MSLCSLCMRILTCSCISVSGHSGTLPFLPVCVYVQKYFNILLFLLFPCAQTLCTLCAHTRVSLIHSLINLFLHCHILLSGPFVHLFTPLTTLINITQFPLPDLFVCSCSPYMLIPRPSCFFCVWPISGYIFLYSPMYIQRILFYFY
ncbi:hypothetical protein NERG_02619 [Nematocida ausubeli]|uniref:Uncharacterized protein n=1 Tax=Nematocida ausubeli (strain ATCC PRA-371 / ERTm2) TaxID=1913371 RepID=H8ZG98_NEMA1|nr:hypothetical protein NERG_02619 [Nematocida ausubeli]